jgi:hypothetical protein
VLPAAPDKDSAAPSDGRRRCLQRFPRCCAGPNRPCRHRARQARPMFDILEPAGAVRKRTCHGRISSLNGFAEIVIAVEAHGPGHAHQRIRLHARRLGNLANRADADLVGVLQNVGAALRVSGVSVIDSRRRVRSAPAWSHPFNFETFVPFMIDDSKCLIKPVHRNLNHGEFPMSERIMPDTRTRGDRRWRHHGLRPCLSPGT